MTTLELLRHAQSLPLHDPARMALLDAWKQIVTLGNLAGGQLDQLRKCRDKIDEIEVEKRQLRQALDYANEARGGIGSLKRLIAEKNQQLDDAQTDRSNLLCACARIGWGEGSADEYSKTARAALAGLCDRAVDEVDNPNRID